MLTARRWLMMLATGVAGAVTLAPAAAVPVAAAAPLAAGVAAAPAYVVNQSQQQVFSMLDVPAAWRMSEGSGVTIAVIDSGVYPYVSDLTGSVILGPDLTGLSTPRSSPHWGEHGTWMASIIAGHGHDGGTAGIIGVAPKAKILSIRVIPDKDDPGYTTYEHEPEQAIQQSLAEGIDYAVQHHAQVISMSIGYSAASAVVREAVQYAYSHGVVLVASSGNSGHDDERTDHNYAPVSFPADYPGVIGVGAVNSAGAPAGFSSNNLSVQVAAPGVRVPAQGRDGLYWTVDGTSPACALVAGIAALIKSRYPNLTPALVLEALTTTAHNRLPGSYNPQTGFGTVDAAAALRFARGLERPRAVRSQVASSTKFGGGPAGVPAAPVPPRGAVDLVLFSMSAIVSLALIVAASMRRPVLRRPRAGAHAACAGPPGHTPPDHQPPGYGPPGYGQPGYGAPGYGAGRPRYPDEAGLPTDTGHGAQGDGWQR